MNKFRLLIVLLLVIWGMAGPLEANADNNGPGVGGVTVAKSEKKKIRLQTPAGLPVEVIIMDTDGNQLYRKSASNQQVTNVSFNLNRLPDGYYFLTASTNAWWMSQGLIIEDNTVYVDYARLQQVTQPQVTTYGNNKVAVNFPVTNTAPTNVGIYDAQNLLLFSETVNALTRRYDLSSLKAGAYTFVMGPDQKQLTTRVTVSL